jgi:hypothetical protein
VGDRVVTPDGRVFRYAQAGAVSTNTGVLPNFGAYNPYKVDISAVAPAQVAPASPVILGLNLGSGSIGDWSVTVTVGAAVGPNGDGSLTQNQLAGGYIVIGDGTSQNATQNRCIIGNDALAAGGGSVNVYLDGSLTTAVTPTTTYIEILPNPYAGLVGGTAPSTVANTNAYVTFLGIPTAAATKGQYFWLQTFGPLWTTNDGNTNKVANGRDLFFQTDGSLRGQQGTASPLQRAGICMDACTSGTASAPIYMLQIGI